MKAFTTLKIGYSVGVYGCSNEFFTTIISDNGAIQAISFYGMYGADERVNAKLKGLGYQEHYAQSFFGKMTKKDLTKNCISEFEALARLDSMPAVC